MQLDYPRRKQGRSAIVTIEGVDYTKASLKKAVRDCFADSYYDLPNRRVFDILAEHHPLALALSPVYVGWEEECFPLESTWEITVVFDRYIDPRKERAGHFRIARKGGGYIVGVHAGLTVLFHGLDKLKESRAKDAFRWEISGQSRYYRWQMLESHPELEGMYESDRYSVHVDHIKPFSVLLKEFLAIEGLTLSEVKTEPQETNTYYARRLTDPELGRRWVKFHLENAQFQLLSREDNLKKGDKSL